MRPIAGASAASLLVALAVLGACRLPRRPPPGADGPTIYAYQNCANCHGAAAEGRGSLGPPLRGLAGTWTADGLRAFLIDPSAAAASDPRLGELARRYKGRMGSYRNLSDRQLDVLTAWLLGR